MKAPTLALRVSRRAIGAATLADEQLSFYDGRYLRSRREAAITAATRYIARLLELVQPQTIFLDCPRNEGSTTDALLSALDALLRERHVEIRHVPTTDLLRAYGASDPPTRAELRNQIEAYWPELPEFRGKVKPYVADAAAAALYADTAAALGAFPPLP